MKKLLLTTITFLTVGCSGAIAFPPCDSPTSTTDVWIANPDTTVINFDSAVNLIQSLGLDPKICTGWGAKVIQFATTEKGQTPSSYNYLNNRSMNPQKLR